MSAMEETAGFVGQATQEPGLCGQEGYPSLMERLSKLGLLWESSSDSRSLFVEIEDGCSHNIAFKNALSAGETRHAWCQMCGPAKTNCSTLCRVRNGRWVSVEGNPNALNNGHRGSRSLCAKGNAAIQALYDPNRLMFPMRRTGPKGEGRFARCTWDEAYTVIAARLTEVKARCGPEAFGVLSPQAYRVLWSLGRRFLNVYGSPNYLHSGICALQRAASSRITIGKATCEPGQLDKTKLYVAWGANPENSEVNRGRCTAQLDEQARGMKIIDIRPMLDPLAAKADMWLPVRPGTDGALALAILHVIIGEDLYDRAFVETWCHGFEELARHVRQYTPAWAARVTGVPESLVIKAARLMGTVKPMGIHFGNGIGDQQSDGNWTCVAICLIEAITGNLDVPGGGGVSVVYPPLVHPRKFDVLTERLKASAEDEGRGYYAGMSKLVAPEMPRWYQNPKTWESGPNSAYFKGLMSVLTEEPYPLRMVLGQASNPLSATRQPKLVAKALAKLDFYVVHDTCWNPSCDYADYVLPACTHYECSQQFGMKNGAEGTFIGLNQKLVDPLGDSRSDWDFYLGLAVAMGYGEDFWQGNMDACLREQLEGSGVTLEQLRAASQGVFVERPSNLREELPAEMRYRRYEQLFSDLPFGKVQCTNEWIGGRPSADGRGMLGRLPVYAGPPEGMAETPDLAREYPLVFSDVHAFKFCNHGYYVGLPYLRAEQPLPWVKINPETARRYGIRNGDWVRVESPHGWAKFVAEYFEGIAPGVLMARRGWWQPCDTLGLPPYSWGDGGSEPSVLYNADASVFDPFHSAMPKQTLVKVSSLGSAKPVQARFDMDEHRCLSNSEDVTDQGGRFFVSAGRCIGCGACVVACKQTSGLTGRHGTRRWIVDVVTGMFPHVKCSFISQSCRHCAVPACVAVCPAGAIVQRGDGIVAVDAGKCMGCRRCGAACPHDVPRFVDGVMDKCNCCLDVHVAPDEDPPCVRTCPTGALRLQGRASLSTAKKETNYER